MIAVKMPTVMNVHTNPMVHPSLSMTYLLLICSAAPGLAELKCKPGAVGLKSKNIYGHLTYEGNNITKVNNRMASTTKSILLSCESGNKATPLLNWLALYIVNTSGKYQGNVPQGLGGSGAPASYFRLKPGITWKGIRRVWMQAWRWSASPSPLCCKVRFAASHLLY